jgi:hypothetical protein
VRIYLAITFTRMLGHSFSSKAVDSFSSTISTKLENFPKCYSVDMVEMKEDSLQRSARPVESELCHFLK